MADIVSLSDALVGRLLPVITPLQDGWTTSWFKPEPVIKLPMLCVMADPNRFVDYTQVPTAWFLRIGFYLSSVDQEASRRMMSTLTDRNGPVISALESPDIEDTLFGLVGLTVSATVGRGWDLVKERRNTYLEADIGVQLNAD